MPGTRVRLRRPEHMPLCRASTSCLPLSSKTWMAGTSPALTKKLRYGRMLFYSYPFIFLFLPSTLIGYFVLVRLNHLAPVIWLGLGSPGFSSVSNWSVVAPVLASIALHLVI